MEQLKHILSAVLFSAFLLQEPAAQQVVATAGGSAGSSSGHISFTIGELVTETYSGTDKKLTQGFHQPRFIVTHSGNLKEADFSIRAFPNPTHDYIHISIEKASSGLTYYLTDMQGKILLQGTIPDGEAGISFASMAPGSYLLKVYRNRKELKTLKILKI